jgi:hypothetical protein
MNENKVTLYVAAQIINELFKRDEISRTIKPQMLYNYNGKGTLSKKYGIKTDENNRISLEDVKKLYEGLKTNSRTNNSISDLADAISTM